MTGAGGVGGLLARTDTNGTTYYHCDANGNVTALIDANGNIVAQVVARRIESGLAFDDDSVRRAIENSGRPGYPLPGFFYTPEEEAALGNADPPERSG